jgi:hypothetical protein
MRKFLMFLGLLIMPAVLYAGYYNVNHQQLVADTTTIKNQWYIRGDYNFVSSTYPATVASGTANIRLLSTGTVRATQFEGSGAGLTGITISDSQKWNTMEVTTSTLADKNLMRYDIGTSKWIMVSSGAAGSFLRADYLWSAPAGGGDMLQSIYDADTDNIVDNSIQLSTHTYDHFVNTATYQTVGGSKTWSDYQTFQSSITISSHTNIAGILTSARENIGTAVISSLSVVGVYQRIAYYECTSDSATTITFTGLDLSAYKIVTLRFIINAGAGTSSMYILFNGDTGNNYTSAALWTDLVVTTAACLIANPTDTIPLGLMGTGGGVVGSYTIGCTGLSKYKSVIGTSYGLYTQHRMGMYGGYWNNHSANITKIEIKTTTNGFGTGSVFELYGDMP